MERVDYLAKKYCYSKPHRIFIFVSMKQLLIIISLMFIYMAGFSQYRMDFGLKLGGTNYLGEMGGLQEDGKDFVADIKLQTTRPAFGLFVSYEVSPQFFVSGSIMYGRITGADSLSKAGARYTRNLHFRNDIYELAVRGEVTLLDIFDITTKSWLKTHLRGYGYVGIASYYHNPEAEYKGEWVKLRPLMTEGQEVSYSNFGFSIPIGIGVAITHNKRYRIGWEIGWRTTFTDYLDDVSSSFGNPTLMREQGNPVGADLSNRTYEKFDYHPNGYTHNAFSAGAIRGDPTDNDTYIFSTINFSYVIKGQRRMYRRKKAFNNKRRRRIRRTRNRLFTPRF
jgi:hypothetical protein